MVGQKAISSSRAPWDHRVASQCLPGQHSALPAALRCKQTILMYPSKLLSASTFLAFDDVATCILLGRTAGIALERLRCKFRNRTDDQKS